MRKTIENKIRYKAILIYIVVTIGVLTVILYLNSLRKEVSSARLRIEEQHKLLEKTNDLMFAVSEAQSFSSLYLSTKRRKYLTDYLRSFDTIKSLIDTMVILKPNDEEQLRRIRSLVGYQLLNIRNLNIQLAKDNPLTFLNERLKAYESSVKDDTLYMIKIKHDTIYSKQQNKNFFERLKDAFKPSKDSIRFFVNQRIDTLHSVSGDSLAFISEVGHIAEKAHKDYEQNIKDIELHVREIMLYDYDLSAEISALLLEFHHQTLESTLFMINRSEKAIYRNYMYSSIIGFLALSLIFLFIWLIIGDINKGRQAREALEQANEKIRQTMESRHKLLLSVSHDIKSPLNSILGYLSMMEEDANVRSMQNSSQHILSMLENLLKFSSLEQGNLDKSLSDFHIDELFEEIYNMFLPLANQKNINFSFHADPIRVKSDKLAIKQIVINVVSNAIKYTREGSVSFDVQIINECLHIQVKDTGVGMPSEKISDLFKPFVRMEENTSLAHGSGLGMFVVKGLLDILNGSISVNSIIGTGSTIHLEIPIILSSKTISKGVKKIKIYEDDPVFLKVVQDMLMKLDHQVVDQGYDLILSDMEMDDVSGLDILKEAKDIPVVIMTGRGDFSDAKAKELGFSAFLSKPFSINELREVVGENQSKKDDFLGEDREEIQKIFRLSCKENFNELRKAMQANDYQKAQAICHKMYPMFAQLGYPIQELRKIDQQRNSEYQDWQKDVKKILSITI